MAEFFLVVAVGAIFIFFIQGIGVRFLFGSNGPVVEDIYELENYNIPVVGFMPVFHADNGFKFRIYYIFWTIAAVFVFVILKGLFGTLATMGFQMVLMGWFGQGIELFLFKNVTDFIATPIGIVSLGDIAVVSGLALFSIGLVPVLI